MCSLLIDKKGACLCGITKIILQEFHVTILVTVTCLRGFNIQGIDWMYSK